MGSVGDYNTVSSGNFPTRKISNLELDHDTHGLVSLDWTTSGRKISNLKDDHAGEDDKICSVSSPKAIQISLEHITN